MKTCFTCKETKSLDQFYKKSGRITGSSACKKCFNKYCSKRFVDRKKQAIIYKGSKCVDCQATYPEEPYVVFDFHHLDPSQKDVEWVQLKLRSWEKIMIELDKCVLLCSNCHRKRHMKE